MMTTPIIMQPPAEGDYNGWADFWRNDIGLNVIPWNKGEGRNKKVSWTDWQTEPIPQGLHDSWKSNDMFKDGIARISGICWHNKPFDPRLRFWDADVDKQSAIDAICTRNGKKATIEELSKIFIVEGHEDDPERLHISGYYLSDKPYLHIPPGNICELKCDGTHGIVRCTNSLHYFKENGKLIEKGHRYKIIGTIQPTINNAFVEHILGICGVDIGDGNGHARDQTKPSLASTFWKDGATVNEGENRHAAMLSLMDSLLIKFPNENLEVIFQMAMAKNRLLCNPPLPEDELRKMFDEQCVKFARKKLEERTQPNTTKRQQQDDSQEEESEEEEEESPDEAEQQQTTQRQAQEISVSEALRMPEGFYKIRGQLSSYTSLYCMVAGRKDSTCIKCGIINPGRRFKRPIFSLDTSRRKCHSCFSGDAVPIIPEYIPTIDIELQDLVKISEIEKIWVHVFGKDTENIIESDVVTITGNTYVEKKDGKTRSVPVMYSHIIEDIEKEEELSPQDIQEINEWKERYKKDIIGGLVPMFAPHIVGNENTKEGMLMVFANAGIPNDRDPNNYTRHRIHQLLIGDPGEAKTRFASYIADSKIIPGARYESAQSSTGLSLTAQVDKEGNGSRYTLRRGPLALARGSICALNEIDKMKSLSEHHHFLDTMEEGEFTINKYGKHYKIPANTSVVASANPINQKWKDTTKIDLNEIPTIEQNIQRFDIISVFRAPTSKAGMIKYHRAKREVERKYSAGEFDDYIRFLRNYFKYVRGPLFSVITIKKEAEDMLDTYVCEMPDRGITGLKRRRESLRRLVTSRARLKLKNVADEEDAEEIMKFYNVMLMHEEKTIAVSKRPNIETYDVCIEMLKKNKSFPYSYIELMETVRKGANTSEQVKQYIGSGDLHMEYNRNVKNVVELLLKHSNIRQTRDRRGIVLQWVDDDAPKSDDDMPPVDIPPVNPQPTDTTIGAQTQTQETSNEAQRHVNVTEPTVENNDFSSKQKSTFRRIFDELEREAAGRDDEKEVLGPKFREALVSSGDFNQDNIDMIIEELGDGFIEQIYTEFDGVIWDIYRRKSDN